MCVCEKEEANIRRLLWGGHFCSDRLRSLYSRESLKASVIAQNPCVGCEDFVGSVLVAPSAPVGFHFPYRHFVAGCSSGQSLQTTRIGNSQYQHHQIPYYSKYLHCLDSKQGIVSGLATLPGQE